MASGDDAEAFDQYAAFGPFGHHGNEVGQCALRVLASLSKPAPTVWEVDGKPIVWDEEDDFHVIDNLHEALTGLRFIEPHPEMDGGDVGDLHRAFFRLHVALPLSETERLWLFDPVERQPDRPQQMERPETLLGLTEEVMSGGVLRVIQGREIVRRMSAWRREAQEFAGQGSLQAAKDALSSIATMTLLESRWPQKHAGLRRNASELSRL